MTLGPGTPIEDRHARRLLDRYLDHGDMDAGRELMRACAPLSSLLLAGFRLPPAVASAAWCTAWQAESLRHTMGRLWRHPVLEELVLGGVLDALRGDDGRLREDIRRDDNELSLWERVVLVLYAWRKLTFEQIAALLNQHQADVAAPWKVFKRWPAPAAAPPPKLVLNNKRLFLAGTAPDLTELPGRTDAREALKLAWGELRERDRGGVVALLARPGLGTSALLRWWLAEALLFKDDLLRPRRILALDLSRGQTLSALLDDLLRWFDIDPGPHDQRLPRLAARLTEAPNLLILDGVREHSTDVHDLLALLRDDPGNRSVVFIGSERPGLPGETHQVALRRLDPGHGAELLHRRCSALDPNTARDIARALGGHPAALDLVGRAWSDRITSWQDLVALHWDPHVQSRGDTLRAMAEVAAIHPDSQVVVHEQTDSLVLCLPRHASVAFAAFVGEDPAARQRALGLRWLRVARHGTSALQEDAALPDAPVDAPPPLAEPEPLEPAGDPYNVYVLACHANCARLKCTNDKHSDMHMGLICMLRQQIGMLKRHAPFYDNHRGMSIDRMATTNAAVLLMCTHIASDTSLVQKICELCERARGRADYKIFTLLVDDFPIEIFADYLRFPDGLPLVHIGLQARKTTLCQIASAL